MSDGLDALALAGDQLGADQAEAGPQPQPGPPPISPNVGAIALALTAFRELASRMLEVESPKHTLNDDAIGQVAGVLAPLCDKYGWNLDMAEWGPEVAAALVAGPILWHMGAQLNLELKAKKAKPVDQAAAEPDATPA